MLRIMRRCTPILALCLLLTTFTLSTVTTDAATTIKDLKLTVPTDTLLLRPNENATVDFSFAGIGISRVKLLTSSASLRASFTDSAWAAYPGTCSATLKVTAKKGFSSGYLTVQLINDEVGVIKSAKIYFSANAYDVEKALEFASAHARTNDEWLCAEFVSRCVEAGGTNCGIHPGVGNLFRALDKLDNVKRYQLKVDSSGKILPEDNDGKISSGDVIIMYCTTCNDGKPFLHAVLVGDVSKSGIKVYAHNKAYKNETYTAFNYCKYCNKYSTICYCFHFV